MVGGLETGSQAERSHGKAAAGRPGQVADCGLQIGWSHIHVQINREEQLGSKTD